MIPPTWSHLHSAALTGTRHAASSLPLTGDSGAHELLLAAGTLQRHERARWQPMQGTGMMPLPPPPETQPCISPLGEHLLETMLEGTFSAYLHGYFRELATRGQRVPHRLLAAVLDKATQQSHLPYEDLPEVLGERGHWLARLHPAWRPLVTIREERTWTHGTPDQRRRFLLAARRRDPAHGRALLAASLPHDSPWLQATFLHVLYWQLTADDEPLLRTCLHSPEREVRQAALSLLQRLPGHGLVEQLWEWATQYLTVTTRPDTGPVLLVTLPERWQPEWQQAGIEREEYNRCGQQAGWLRQMLALIPVQRWSEHWQLPPLQLLEMASATAVGADLLAGWSSAAYHQQQPDWSAAFLAGNLTRPPAAQWPDLASGCAGPAQAEALLLPLIPGDARLSDTPAPWQEALWKIRWSWTAPLLRRVLQLLEDSLHAPATEGHHRASRTMRQLVFDLVEEVYEPYYDEIESRLQALLDAKLGPLERLGWALQQLRFQRQLRLSLTEAPPMES